MEIKQQTIQMHLCQIDRALKNKDMGEILDQISDFYTVWKLDEAENYFYSAYAYNDVSQLLSEIAKDGHLTEILARQELYKMLPKTELADILIENQDVLSADDFEKFQDYIISAADECEIVKIAGVRRTNFEKIQDKILSSTNAYAIGQFVQIFPCQADVARAYERLKTMRESKKLCKNKSVRENFDTVKRIFNENSAQKKDSKTIER